MKFSYTYLYNFLILIRNSSENELRNWASSVHLTIESGPEVAFIILLYRNSKYVNVISFWPSLDIVFKYFS